MKRKLKIILWVFTSIILLLALGLFIFSWKARYGINFYETTPPEIPKTVTGKSILVFSKTNGFRHDEAIEASIPAFKKIAKSNDWSIFTTDNGAVFNPDQLQKFDVVIWNNCSGKVLNEAQRGHFKRYLVNGGGFLGIHASGDNSHQWDWYEEKVLGALFSHHPLNPQFQTATMSLEEGDNVMTAGLPVEWNREEEWYMFFDNPRDKGFQVLYTVDETNMNPSGNISFLVTDKDWGMGKDHPIVWYHALEKGRVVYSALGHSGSAFEEPNHLQLLENAIRWAGRF